MTSEKEVSDATESQQNEATLSNQSEEVINESKIEKNEVSEEKSEKEEDKPELTETEKLQLQIEEKDKEIASLKDKMLRLQAQTANDRKRFKSDADRSAFDSKKRFLKRILDIRDNIDRALSAFDPNDEQQKSHAEGVKMIADQMDDMFAMEGIKEMQAKGEMYDLLKHEIVSRVPYNGPENRVIDVVQKGYIMDNKVLRVAKVVLSMKKPKDTPNKETKETKTEKEDKSDHTEIKENQNNE